MHWLVWHINCISFFVKNIQNLLAVIFLLMLLPASASAALIVSDWTATPTSLSFKITGTIDEGVTIGPDQDNALFIGPSNLAYDSGIPSYFGGTASTIEGSPTAISAPAFYNTGSSGAKIQIRKAGFATWAAGDILSYSVTFSDPSLYDVTAWNPTGGIVSAGRSSSGYANAPEVQYQVGSFASVPDTGSTAALLGAGVAALAFAKRKLG